MSDPRREVTLSISTFAIAVVATLALSSMADDVDRLADAADTQMCIEGMKAGIDRAYLPGPCQNLRKESQ